MAEEMRLHLEHRIAERIAEGMSPEEARFAAMRAFGPITQVQEQCREQRGWHWLELLGRDLRHGARSLARTPGFTVVALLTLGLGIGANTAVFSLVKSVLLNPLPFRHGERLVAVWEQQRSQDPVSFSWPEFEDLRNRTSAFSGFAGYRLVNYAMTGQGEPEQCSAAQITASMLAVLRLSPQLGRMFDRALDSPGAEGVVLLSDAFWRRRFSADPNVLGRILALDNVPFEVIGVLPPEFAALANVDFATQLGRASGNNGWGRWTMRPGVYGLGRLRDGVTLEQARADLRRVGSLLARDRPDTESDVTPAAQSLFDQTVSGYRQGLWLLLGAVGLVLVVACANLANLLFARGVGRQAEIAVRAALGASLGRIMSETLAESLLLAFGGGALGLLLTLATRGAIASLSPMGVERFHHARIDGGVLAATLAASFLTALLCGAWPAWNAAQIDIRRAMEGGPRTTSASRGVVRVRESLIVGEVALTLMLLVGAGLLLKSFARAQAVDLGFQARGVLTARLKVPYTIYNSGAKLLFFNERLLAALAATPGIRSATIASALPIVASGRTLPYVVNELPPVDAGQLPPAEINVVSQDYFDVLGIPILRGRGFEEHDTMFSPRVAVVDRTFADRYWRNGDALGKVIRLGTDTLLTIAILPLPRPDWIRQWRDGDSNAFTIAGVVPSVHTRGYSVEPRLPQVYLCERQHPINTYLVALRTAGDPSALEAPLRKAVQLVDANQPIWDVRTLDQHLSATFAASRLYTSLLSIFAGLALLLASIGLYGVLAFQVSTRRREFGIRLALGGLRSQIVALVLRRGMRLIAMGFALGICGAVALARVLRSLLYRTSELDAGVILSVSILLAVVSLMASWLPSRRASRVAPSEALRSQ